MFFKLILLCCVLVLNDAADEGERCDIKGVKGTCTLIENCPAVIEGLKRRIPPQNCGYLGTIPIVCCVQSTNSPNKPPKVTITTPRMTTAVAQEEDRSGLCGDVPAQWTIKKTGQKALDKCIDYQEAYVYPCEKVVAFIGGYSRTRHCHHKVDELVVGGNNTRLHEFPHMVMLGYEDFGQPLSWRCGGSIISERFVLTAAHCSYNIHLGEPKYVVAGALTRTDANDRSKVFKVKRNIRYPGYKSPSQYHDIALVEMESDLPLSQFVVPACLHVGDPIDDARALVTGWGLTTEKGSVSEIMQKAYLNKFSTDECYSKFPEHRNLDHGFDELLQACYGDKNKSVDTCQGDSGGPIQIKNRQIDCMYTIVGVTAFGKQCGLIGEPGIYTKVSYYVPWIESIVWP